MEDCLTWKPALLMVCGVVACGVVLGLLTGWTTWDFIGAGIGLCVGVVLWIVYDRVRVRRWIREGEELAAQERADRDETRER